MDEWNNLKHPEQEGRPADPIENGDTGEYRWRFDEYENALPPDPGNKKTGDCRYLSPWWPGSWLCCF